ncbi:MAG: tetratricopeptide repeat protein [Rhizomicrobium sp.]
MNTEDTDEFKAALTEAKALLRANPASAESHVRRVLRDSPEHPDALFLLALALRRQGKSFAARSVLDILVQLQPQRSAVYYEMGLTLAKLGDNAKAIDSLRTAVDLDPDFAPAWQALGDQLTRMRGKNAAGRAYAKYQAAEIRSPVLRDATAALREDQPDRARDLLVPWIDANPADVNAIKLLADAAIKSNRLSRAGDLLAHCLEIAPDFIAARYQYAVLLMTQNKAREAIAQADELLAQEPEDLFFRNLKAASLIRLSAYSEAIIEYAKSLEIFPNQPGAWLSYGHALKALGRHDEAISAYRKALSLLSGLGEAYWSLANLKTYRLQRDETDAIVKQLARREIKGENRALMHFALGKAFEDDGRYEDSFGCYRQGNDILRSIVAVRHGRVASADSKSQVAVHAPILRRTCGLRQSKR